MEKESSIESQYALLVAFQTMKERCQKLQARLSFVEEENYQLSQYKKNTSLESTKPIADNENNIDKQENIEELKNQRSRLSNYIFMVSSENQQLWKRLSWLAQFNKSVDNQLTPIPDKLLCKLKNKPFALKDVSDLLSTNKSEIISHNDVDRSLEEISLRMIDNIINEKSDKNNYSTVSELYQDVKYNLKNIGFTYPDDINLDSTEKLKYHSLRLDYMKETLLSQQNKLKNALQNLNKKIKSNETTIDRKISKEKLACITKTQHNLDNSLSKTGMTQSNLFTTLTSDKKIGNETEDNVCPLCGIIYKKSVPFNLFHEHVIDHFTKEGSNDLGMFT